VLGLESGALCDLFEVAPEIAMSDASGSIGWRGEILYVCTEAGLVRMSLLDGRAERVAMACTAAAANDDAVFVMRSFADASPEHPPGEVVAYASADDLRADRAAKVYQLRGSSRLAATDDRLYGAWHSTHTIDRVDLATGAALEPIALDGYDDWVNGFSVLDDGSLVVNKFVGGAGVTMFDAATGARTGASSPARPLNGLACVSAKPASE
jgi:hypothetical protein